MKLSEQHIFKGYWWLPYNPEDRVAGVLTYTPGDKILLELIGGFCSNDVTVAELFDDENKNIPLIYGIDSNAKEITLLTCHRSFSINFSSEFPMMRYSAQFLIYDKHIGGIDEVCDYSAHIRYPELSYWVHPSAIQQLIQFSNDGEEIESCSFQLHKIDTKTEPLCSVVCENGIHLTINRGSSFYPGELMLKPEIEQFSYLTISKPGSGVNIREVFREIFKFGQFLSLATKRNVNPESIYLTDPKIKQDFKDGQKSFLFPIYLLYIQHPVPNLLKIDRNKFLFCYEDLAERMPTLVEKWMSESDKLRPIKNHLVDSIVYKPVVGSVDFLQVVQALEGIWWRFRDTEYKLYHPSSKKTSLYTILSELIKSLSAIPSVSKIDIDIKAVVDSRVFYTHFVDKAERRKVADGFELYDLTKKLRLILLCLTLELLGLSSTEIEIILSKRQA